MTEGAEGSGWLEWFVQEHRGRPDAPLLEIHANDEMHQWAKYFASSPEVGELSYVRAGTVIADTVRQLGFGWCGPAGPSAYLDFACGYGRSLRFTVQDFGADQVWGSEILPQAVDFVRDRLGAHSFLSATDPDDLAVDQRFDLIFVSSLFSHLPDKTFGPWLARLHSLLAEGGLLVISTHDEFLLPDGATLDERGYYFQPTTEVDALDPEEYGATVVSEGYVAAAIAEFLPHGEYRRFPTALCFEQDLFAIPQAPDDRLAGLELFRGPQGALDELALEGPRLRARGWAATQDEGEKVDYVELRLNGQLIALPRPESARPDVAKAVHAEDRDDCLHSGWSVEVPWTAPLFADDVVTATAVTTSARRGTFYGIPVSDLVPGLPLSARSAPPATPPATVSARVMAKYRAEGLGGLASAATHRLKAEAETIGAAVQRRRQG